MAQYAIAYAPNLSGGQPANTVATGSFYIGSMINGRTWNQAVPQTTTTTYFCASPNDTTAYVIALPNPSPSAPFNGTTAPQFYYSLLNGAASKTDGAFIATCDYILKRYTAAGAVASPGGGVNPAGCASVSACQAAINAAGFWQSYGFVAP